MAIAKSNDGNRTGNFKGQAIRSYTIPILPGEVAIEGEVVLPTLQCGEAEVIRNYNHMK